MRKRGRRDGNHKLVIRELRAIGYSVHDLGGVGDGCPDIVVGAQGKNWLFEIKDPAQPPSKRRLTSDERIFFANWRGQVRKVETAEEIIEVVRNSYGRSSESTN